jgi:hypothetical protein
MDNDSINTDDTIEKIRVYVNSVAIPIDNLKDYQDTVKEAIKKDFDKKTYNKQYYEKRKTELKSKDCEICYGSYNLYSHATHLKSKKHVKALDIINKK